MEGPHFGDLSVGGWKTIKLMLEKLVVEGRTSSNKEDIISVSVIITADIPVY
jgi:hypothetical protein